MGENGGKIYDELTYKKLDEQIEPKLDKLDRHLDKLDTAIQNIATALQEIANELHTMKLLMMILIGTMLLVVLLSGGREVFAQMQQVLSVHIPS